ncbi:large ribosomal subunit protein eL29-like [Desmodus rotundus]|uniref:large ribosomal subunit protein eL29-like n=1 Tax=Desmodus rotundus TaxID=9430 RepID=UPI002380DC96|nr:60S ribosomal protein L29-like [Desmodus rotundus]
MHFAKKHNKKDPEKMQANNVKAASAHARAIKTLAKPRSSPRSQRVAAASSIDLPTMLTPSMRNGAHACIAKGLRLCQPKSKVKAQTQAQAVIAAAAAAASEAQAEV